MKLPPFRDGLRVVAVYPSGYRIDARIDGGMCGVDVDSLDDEALRPALDALRDMTGREYTPEQVRSWA